MKKTLLYLLVTVLLCGCCGCSVEKKEEPTGLPQVIEALRSEGQLEAPAYEYLPQYDPVNLNDKRIKAISFESVAYQGEKTRVFAYFGLPENASEEKKVPAVVLVHGGGGTAFPEWVQLWVDAGYAAIAFDTEGQANITGSSAWNPQSADPDNLFKGPSNDYLATSFREINQQWIYHAVSAAMKCTSFLSKLSQVDKNKIGITGISWGGVITSLTMCADERLCFAVPIYCNGKFTEGNMGTSMNGYYSDAKTRELWEPSNYFDWVKAKVLFVNSDHDFSHCMLGTNAAHTLLKGSYQTIIPDLFHGHVQAWEVKETMAFANNCVGLTANSFVSVLSQKIENGTLEVKFSQQEGVKIARAELYAIEGAYIMDKNAKVPYQCGLKEDFRKIGEQEITQRGEVIISVPDSVSYCYVNLITEDGYVCSGNMIKVK